MAADDPDDRLSELAEVVKGRLTAEQVAAEEMRKLGPPRAKPMEPVPPPQVVNVYQAHKVQTIEKTGKKWKAWMLLGGLAMIVSCMGGGGLLAIAGDSPEQASVLLFIVILAFVVGVGLYLVGRIGGWWFHG